MSTCAVSYGASLLLYLRAQRALGAARQSALFAVAPFAGAAASIPLLGDRPAPDLPTPTGLDGLVAPLAYTGAGREVVARLKPGVAFE